MACQVADEGYDALFVEEPPELLLCIICHLVLRKPVLIIECGHRFCEVCYEKMKQHSIERGVDLLCPLDRDVIDISKVFPDKGIERTVLDLKVKCDNQRNGCDWTGDLRSLNEHKKVGCLYELDSCIYGCGIQLERRELQEHMLNCSKKNINVVEMMKCLTERIDACEVECKQRYEQTQEYKQQLQTKTNEMKQTKELLNETKDELQKTKETLKETVDKLNDSDKKLEQALNEQKIMRKRLEKLENFMKEVESETSINDDVKYLCEKIGQRVIVLKHGEQYSWVITDMSNLKMLNVGVVSPSYYTEDGYHIVFRATHDHAIHEGYLDFSICVFKGRKTKPTFKKLVTIRYHQLQESRVVECDMSDFHDDRLEWKRSKVASLAAVNKYAFLEFTYTIYFKIDNL